MAFTDEEGNFAPCNFAVRSADHNLYNTSLKEWMQGEVMENLRSEMTDPNSTFQTVNQYCTKCIHDEEQIGRSRRMIANNIYRDKIEKGNFWEGVLESAITTPFRFKPRILEIQVKSFGIECNLDCQMCFPFSSSIRTKMAFEKGVFNTVVWGNELQRRKQSENAMAWKPVDKINRQIVELAPYIYNLKIIGGEPLVMKKHYELLDMLIESGDAKDIQVKYQTNATVTKAGKHNIFDYIPKFKRVLVTVSLDGVGKYNDYIRRRGNYKEIAKNIKEFEKYPNVGLELNSVATFFSVLHLYKMKDEWPGYINHWWPIDYPDQMKANNLPQDIKDRLIPIYEKIPHMKEIATLLKIPPEENFQPKELYKYCMDMDESYKGTKWEMNVLDIFPELQSHYEGLL
jgi:MoaA/NifB/PqqE/SkfB family radical SAM enzyme